MTEFSKNDVDLIVAVSVLSDQTRRVETRLAEIEQKLDDNTERLARLETQHSNSASSFNRWAGWGVAAVFLLVEFLLQFVVK